jgi:hypothetical protein
MSMKNKSTKNKGTTDESIGRPGPWREGRYQQAGENLDNAVAPDQPLDSKNPVKTPAAAKVATGPVSTPVHLDEYTAVAGKPRDTSKDRNR